MINLGKKEHRWGPQDYWRIGPVYVRKQFALLVVIGLSITVLAIFGIPFRLSRDTESQISSYRYNDPELAEISGLVQVLDDQDQVRYVGEVDTGAYTGPGKVYSETGELLYDGPLIDGKYEGSDAKVYQSGTLVYIGEMAGNLYEGQGRRINPTTGVVSEGQFSRGYLEGPGQEFYADGTLLRDGMFSHDLLEGDGSEYSQEGILLREGTFSAGLLHGDGRQYTASGKLLYDGQFWRGIYHGQGTLYDTLLGVRSVAGTFVYGKLTGQGTIYHPSGQLLYTGQVCGERPRADAFLGLSLAEVEAAFTSHWILYSYEGVTAFVYPYFNLMFITESPVELSSPSQAEEIAQQERQELLDAIERPTQVVPTETEGISDVDTGEDAEGEGAAEDSPKPKEPTADTPTEQTIESFDAAYTASISATSAPIPIYDDEILSVNADKQSIIITKVLSYGQPLPCVAQPEQDDVSGQHLIGWQEWFCDFAAGAEVQDASVRQSGQFIFRFTPAIHLETNNILMNF